MKVGNYHFYFKLMDSDGNETDFIAESGLVSVFIGQGSYSSVHTGNKNENSNKQIEFRLDNIDSAYDYISIYYSRYTAENSDNPVYEYIKINKKYNRNSPKIVITGFEETETMEDDFETVEVSSDDIDDDEEDEDDDYGFEGDMLGKKKK